MSIEYKKIGVQKGIQPIDQIEVKVKGLVSDDRNPIIGN